MDDSTKTEYSLKTLGADGDGLTFLFSRNGHKYEIKFENGAEIVNEPAEPKYLRAFERAAKRLGKNGVRTTKFPIVGVPGRIRTDAHGLESEFVFPGFLNIVLPFSVAEPSPNELGGKIGLRLNCIMKSVDN